MGKTFTSIYTTLALSMYERHLQLKKFCYRLGKLSKIKTTKHMEFSICWLKKIKVSKNAQNGFLCI